MRKFRGVHMLSRRVFIAIGLGLPRFIEAGVDDKSARYIGGTLAVPEGVEGKLDTSEERAVKFTAKGHAPVEIAYDRITSLEYGQKAGRRVGSTIALGVTTLGIGALPMLFSKKRRHYLSIGFTDADGKAQGAVIELGKNITRGTLMVLQTRSGKEVEYESEDAKKHIGN
jgi:hypothetical protein